MLKKLFYGDHNDDEDDKFERIINRIHEDYVLDKNEIDEDRKVSRSVVLGRITYFMRMRYQAGDNTPISLRSILINTNQKYLGWDMRYWLYSTAIQEQRHIVAVDGGLRFMYKPTYKINNFEELVHLLKKAHDRNLHGILLEEVIESMPNAEKILKENESRILFCKNNKTRKITLKYKLPPGQRGVSQHVSKYVPQYVPRNVTRKVPQKVSTNSIKNQAKKLSADSAGPSTSAVKDLPIVTPPVSVSASTIPSNHVTAPEAAEADDEFYLIEWLDEEMDLDTQVAETEAEGVLVDYDAALDEYIIPNFPNDKAN